MSMNSVTEGCSSCRTISRPPERYGLSTRFAPARIIFDSFFWFEARATIVSSDSMLRAVSVTNRLSESWGSTVASARARWTPAC